MAWCLLIFALAACGSRESAPPPSNPGSGGGSGSAPSSPISDDGILEAVFLHEIAAADIKPDETPCLRIRDAAGKTADAGAELLARVRAKHPKAVVASACQGGGRDPVRVIDPPGPGVMFDIGPVVRDAMGIRVNGGGGHRGGGSAREIEYTMIATGSSARVASERLLITN